MLFGFLIIVLCAIFGRHRLNFYCSKLDVFTERRALPWPPNKVFFITNYRASLQSSHGCKLNTVAWLVELTYVHVVLKRESLLGGLGKARFHCKGTYTKSDRVGSGNIGHNC